ncbi:AraC-like DNA-binding protein [Chitinophaga niastensis]|uniref:AraC-like DNA-binding protein n=1 Tax=Chitinophaga niastensis TaxID=536980 RepID=A0A2P8HSE7_CHINA|nr:helix-turn-helix transcriptional regulator [Chitinophaga niastensis]PSL49122.1 AraC-like DNA-binding protein [Chitinophaga niastensis]
MPVDILAHIFRNQPSPAVMAMLPSVALLPVVECYYWYTHLHNKKTWAALDGQPALVILLDTATIKFTGNCDMEIRDAFFCNGTLENTYIEKLTAGMRLLIVKFTADGLSHIKPQLPDVLLPIAKLWESSLLPLTDIRKSSQLQQAKILNTFLEQQLLHNTTGNFLLQAATASIRECKGRLTVAQLCTTLKVNYKWLERNFRRAVGVTPKTYINNIRFLHAYFDVQLTAQPLTGIALDNGYYDQNHFIKAYKKFTGTLPSSCK